MSTEVQTDTEEVPPHYLSASQLAVASGEHPFAVSRLIASGELKPDAFVGRRGMAFTKDKVALVRELLRIHRH